MSSSGNRSIGMLLALCLLNCSVIKASSFVIIPTAEARSRKLPILPRFQHIHSNPTPATAGDLNRSILSIRGGGGGSTNTQLPLSPVSFDNTPFHQFNKIVLAANALGFVASILSGGSHLHLDLLGTGAFAIAAIPTGLASSIPRVQLSAACVSLWATKLASFLFFRALKLKHDPRLTDTLSTTSGTFGFWAISAVWGCLCSLPHALGATSSYSVPLLQSPCSILGAALFTVGLLTETTADVQKWLFKQSNPKQFCNAGIWSISQHPNFLGNMLLWTGIFLMNAPALIDPPALLPAETAVAGFFQTLWRFKRLAIAALSPLFLYTLFSGQASGSITNAKELAQNKYGKDPEYAQYLESVPLIFPNPLNLLSGKK